MAIHKILIASLLLCLLIQSSHGATKDRLFSDLEKGALVVTAKTSRENVGMYISFQNHASSAPFYVLIIMGWRITTAPKISLGLGRLKENHVITFCAKELVITILRLFRYEIYNQISVRRIE